MGAFTYEIRTEIKREITDAIRKERVFQDRKRESNRCLNDWAVEVIRNATASFGMDLQDDKFKTAMLKVATLAIEASQRNDV